MNLPRKIFDEFALGIKIGFTLVQVHSVTTANMIVGEFVIIHRSASDNLAVDSLALLVWD